MKATKQLGAYIRATRKEQNVTLPALAEKAGISKGGLSKIENGNGDPCYSTMLKLSGALNIKVHFGELSR